MTQDLDQLMPIIIERGSYMTRCGFAGSDTTVGFYRTPSLNLEEQFQYLFHEVMEVDPQQYRVVIIKNAEPLQETLQQEARLLFNKFHIRACAFFTAQHGVIFTWVNRGSNGLVIDIGYESTVIAQINELTTVPKYKKILPFGGKDLEQVILKKLISSGIREDILIAYHDQLLPYLMKEFFFFEAESETDFEYEAILKRKQTLSNTFIFQNEEGVSIDILLPDPILSPDLFYRKIFDQGKSFLTELHTQIMYIIDELGLEEFGSEVEAYGNFYWVARIILTGGTSNILGLRSFLIREILRKTEITRCTTTKRTPSNPIIDVELRGKIFSIRNTPSEDPPGSWIGASIAFSLTNSFGFYTTREVFHKDPNIEWFLEHDFLNF